MARTFTNNTGQTTITITSDDVTLDLNGNTIDQASSSDGISIGAVANVTIRNGNIINLGTGRHGINAIGTSELTIEKVNIVGNKSITATRGIDLQGVTNAIINEVTIVNLGTFGIVMESNGSTPTTSVVIKNSSISSTANTGIDVISAQNFLIEDSIITNNSLDGIQFSNAVIGTIKNNQISGNTRNGIAFFATSTANTIINNVIEDNTSNGIQLNGSSERNNIQGNIVSNNGIDGIDNDGLTNNMIIMNYATGNASRNYSASVTPVLSLAAPGTGAGAYSTNDHFANIATSLP